GLRIDDQLEFRRPQYGQVVRPGAAQNLAGVDTDLTVSIGEAGAIAHEPATRRKLADVENAWQPMTGREREDLASPGIEERVVLHDQPCNPGLDQRREAFFDVGIR